MVKDFEVVKGGAGKPKIAGLKNTADRLRNAKENRLSHRTSLDWRLDAKLVTTEEDKGLDLLYTDALMDTVLQSKTVESMMAEENMQNIEVIFDKQTKTSQLYAKKDKIIIALNPNKPQGMLVNTLTRELRHAWQFNNGALLNPMDYEPDNAILLNRAEKADALVFSIKAAWELNLTGESDAWDYMLASPIGSIVTSFEREVREDFRKFNNGKAAKQVYDSLFGRNHTKAFDKQIIHQMLLDDAGYMKKGDKKSFVKIEEITQLGDMPFSSNYIAVDKDVLPIDEKYCKIEDRSNANFLWFIKFERQYQAKEIGMVQEVERETAEILQFPIGRRVEKDTVINKPA